MATRLRQQRIAAGLEIKDAAAALGKSYQYIYQLEQGINAPPTWQLLAEIAKLYQTSTDYLLGVTNNKMSNDLDLTDEIVDLIEAAAKLPAYRQRDLLAMAELFVNRESTNDAQLMSAVLTRVEQLGGNAALMLILDFLDDLDASGFASDSGPLPAPD